LEIRRYGEISEMEVRSEKQEVGWEVDGGRWKIEDRR